MVDLVANASPSDAFVFYYAGHCVKSDDDKHVCAYKPNICIQGSDQVIVKDIVTCDDEKISGSDVRAHLVNSLPQGSRLTAVIDACHSGLLLDLDHYNCKCIIRRRCQSYSERKKPVKVVSPKRRHTHTDQDWLMRNDPQLRAAFRRAAMKMLAGRAVATARDEAEQCQEGQLRIYPAFSLREISLSACAHNERTWEDSKRKGKGMTVKLIKILRKNPSVQVGDLNEQLKRSLSKLAFKRVRKARRAFRELDETISLKRREKLSIKYRDLLDYREQTAQIGSLILLSVDRPCLYITGLV
ncbi:hypothetical protein F5148DRAFT_1281234 [Russula earlei]|uniref:Uncharacterized protein n=1 Tax=Russula earlei TaxID=71964 RepID=A0ACC0UIK7_9AGAM|nr:hypothetical protein F5148DRAFT_1281234 [Russula earlei]